MTPTQTLTLIALFGIVVFIMLLAFEDGVSFGLFKRLKCKFGRHTMTKGGGKTPAYRCKYCNTARKHLRVIDGGNKLGKFDF